MSEGFWVVIGMSIAYLASFMGLLFAWMHYRKRKSNKPSSSSEEK
jgi:hypothetical protein